MAVSAKPLHAKGVKNETKQKELSIYPDGYSELDEVPTPTNTKDEVVLKTLEKARQKYLQALILVEKGDTLNASHYFEDAIDVLNKLTGYQNIEQNEDFSDLAQSIIEDYESYVQSIDNLDENSSFFIIREKLFQEVDSKSTANVTKIQPLDLTRDTLAQAGMDISRAHSREFIPLDVNEQVQKHVAFFTKDKGRKFLKKWLERSTRWFPMMKAIAAEENMPEEIIYLSMIESGLNPNAVSRAKAVGLWQFIRATGELYGLNKKFSVWTDERRDPEKATKAAMRHLSDLFNELGDWHLAMAAYNCGINGVKRAIAKSGIAKPTFWELSPYLPKETRNYVPLYIATTMIASNPAKYGFNVNELQYEPEYAYETYKLTEPVSLKALAKCSGVATEQIQSLNPELIASFTPADATEYTLKLPPGTRQTFIANYATLSLEEKQPWISHTVRRGETLRSIARQYNVSETDLTAANHSAARGKLRRGTVLRIPTDQKETSEENLASVSGNTSEQSNTQTNENTETAATTANTVENTKYITHVVKRGETLYNIAQRYGVRIADLRNMNNIPYDRDNIEAGKKLKIAANSMAKNRNNNAEEDTYVSYTPTPKIVKHVVSSGESLAQIADDYNVTIESIRDLNRIKNNIKAGQVLKIKTEGSRRRAVKENRTELAYSSSEKFSPSATQKKVTHKVRRGDNLGTIAARYGVSESDLKKWNPGTIKGNKVYSGTNLKIYEDNASKGSSAAGSKKVNKLPKYYTIRSGDNLGEIADKFGISVQSLKSKNKKVSERNLRVGQKIRIQ